MVELSDLVVVKWSGEGQLIANGLDSITRQLVADLESWICSDVLGDQVKQYKLAECGQSDRSLWLEGLCKEYDKRAPPWPEGVRQGR